MSKEDTSTLNSTSTMDPVSSYGFSERRFTETYGEKVIRKSKENPFVPIGALATTAALIMASTKLRRLGPNLNSTANSKQFQFWLRARVAFQALTILAVCGGAYVFGQPNLEENQRALEVHTQMVNTKAERERREFDERMRAAEVAQEEEEAALREMRMRTRMQVGEEKERSWWPLSWGRSKVATAPSSPTNSVVSPPHSWLGWLGWPTKTDSERSSSERRKD